MKNRIVNFLIAFICILSTILVLSHLPDNVPVHFDQYGTVDRWGSKYELLLGSAFLILMEVVGELCSYSFRKKLKCATDEKKIKELTSDLKIIDIVFTILYVFLLAMNCMTLHMSYSGIDNQTLQSNADILKVIVVLMGIMMVIMGSYMPKIHRNSVFGFRIGFTMYNDNTWQKSNRIGGIAMIIAGFVTALFGVIFDGLVGIFVMLGMLFAFTFALILVAYFIYKDEKRKEGN